MEFTVTKKYMTLPSGRVDNKKVLFYLDGALVYDLDVNLADGWEQADFTAYVDLGRFAGKTLTVVTEPETALVYGTADEMNLPELYREPLRPCLHFTVKNGWNNDPNGLVYADGVYHMFFQYNPCRAQWGNMHWGHATSRDLVHWTEGDIALFPDEYGTMYSGCAVMDEKNRTGLGSAAHPPMLLYYTAAAGCNRMSEGKAFTQRLFYSTDGGKTFTPYPAPMVEHVAAANRDPKVVYVDEMQCYVMVLYIDGNEFQLFSSADLLHWTHFQTMTFADENECPNLTKVPVVTDGKKNGYRWVLFGAKGIYVVGSFTGGQYVVEQGPARCNSGTNAYAGQVFSGLCDDSVVLIDWVVAHIQDARFTQAMSLPVNLTLDRVDGRFMLTHTPIAALADLRGEKYTVLGLSQQPQTIFDAKTEAFCACEWTLDMPYDSDNVVTLQTWGHTVTVDMRSNEITTDQGACTLSAERKNVSLHAYVDKGVLEIFADGGRFCFTSRFPYDEAERTIAVQAQKPVPDAQMTLYDLKNIWQ